MQKGLKVVPYILLDTRAPIPFPEAQITIYQPSIKEIGMTGDESRILLGVNAITKDYSQIQDKSIPTQLSNFDIFMTVIQEKSEQGRQIAEAVEEVLYLLFPDYKNVFTPRSILLQRDGQVNMIDANTFQKFQDIVFDMFCLAELTGVAQDDYNPGGDRARALVEQFRKKRELLAQLRKERGEDNAMDSLYCRYIDILAVGEKKDKNDLSNYSIFQLVEEFKRFQLKETFDYTIQAKMAGATKIKDAKDWMGSIQFGSDDD